MWEWPTSTGTIPTSRAAHAVAPIGRQIYMFGGRNENMRMNDMYSLNMDNFEWKQLANNDPTRTLQGRSWHTLTSIDEQRLFLFGGYSQDDEPMNDCWLYDTTNNIWTPFNYSFAKPRFWHSAILSNYGESKHLFFNTFKLVF